MKQQLRSIHATVAEGELSWHAAETHIHSHTRTDSWMNQSNKHTSRPINMYPANLYTTLHPLSPMFAPSPLFLPSFLHPSARLLLPLQPSSFISSSLRLLVILLEVSRRPEEELWWIDPWSLAVITVSNELLAVRCVQVWCVFVCVFS